MKKHIIKLLLRYHFDFIFSIYKWIYDKINCQKLGPKNIICIQECVLIVVEILKQRQEKDMDSDKYNYDYLIEVFRMLVNNILNVYIIKSDVDTNRNLSFNQYGNDNYNKKNIELYLSIARKTIEKEKETYIVIADLCMGNLEWGDLICRCKERVFGYEHKEPTLKNTEIMKAIEANDENPFKNKYDRKQFERLKKQMTKQSEISENLNSHVWFNDDGSFTLPYNIPGIERYSSRFVNIIREADKQLVREYEIDRCVKIITVDLDVYNILAYETKNILKKLKRHIKKKYYMITEEDILLAFKSMSNKDDENMKYTYNDVLMEAFLPQPYSIGIEGNEIKKMIKGQIAVFTIIDMDALFDMLRERGFKVYPKKGYEKHKLLYYKNKNWVISKGAFKGMFGYSLIHRLIYGFYTANGLINFIEDCLYIFEKIEE